MLFRSSVYRSVFSFVLIFAMSAFAFADTIRLKDGSIIKGRIVGFNGGHFVVAIGEGVRRREMTFSAAEVESIQFDSPEGRLANIRVSERTQPSTTPARQEPPTTTPVRPEPATPVREEPIVTADDEAKDEVIRDEPEPAAVTPPKVVKAELPRTNTTSPTTSKTKPVELSVKVLADNTANGWTNSGWVVKKGQRIKITGEGRVSLGSGKFSTPSGDPELADEAKLLKSVATGALIAVVGDDNNEFIYVGAEREFTASRDGALFLGVNEGNLNDNSGSYNVKIEIMP